MSLGEFTNCVAVLMLREIRSLRLSISLLTFSHTQIFKLLPSIVSSRQSILSLKVKDGFNGNIGEI